MGSALSDIHHAARALRNHPAFSLIVIVTLALGIGGTTTAFSLVDRLLLRPLPYQQPNRLVAISTPLLQMEFLASVEYLEWRHSNHVLEQLAAWPHSARTGYLTIGDEPIKIGVTRISDNFFDTLRVHPMLGRGFLPEETRQDGANVIILSHGLWTHSFGGDRGVIGRPVVFEGKSCIIVGVLPPDFQFPEQAEIDALTPLPIPTSTDRRSMAAWNTMGRLSLASVLHKHARSLNSFENTRRADAEMYRQDTKLRFVPFQEYRVRNIRLTLLVLFAAAGCVLLIACANAASLLMARAVARQTELAIRAALGASSGSLLYLSLLESLLLASLGGMAGPALAVLWVHLLRRFGTRSFPGVELVELDWRVLLFAILASLLTGLLCGLVPALATLRAHPQLGSTHQITGTSYRPLRRFLVVAEIALSLVLLICGGLLIQTLRRLQNQNLGFRPESVLTAGLSLTGIALPERLAMMDRLHQLPGILAFGFSDGLPPDGGGRMSTFSRLDRPLPEAWHRGYTMLVRRVTPDYFSAIGTPLRKGRLFNTYDRAETNGVALINETLARRYFPAENPIGKQIDGIGGYHWKAIVGIVADAKNRGLDQPIDSEMFTPFEITAEDTSVSIVVRGEGDPLNLVPMLRASLRRADKNLPVTFRALDGNLSERLAAPRFNAALFGTFAAIALLLAIIGIYGVLSYAVEQRTQEIGLRMALGAGTPDIVKLIAVEAMALTLSGVVIGITGAIWATRVLAGQLYGVKPNDVPTFAVVSAILIATAMLAACLPAHRATQVDPMVVLRAE